MILGRFDDEEEDEEEDEDEDEDDEDDEDDEAEFRTRFDIVFFFWGRSIVYRGSYLTKNTFFIFFLLKKVCKKIKNGVFI